MNLEPLTKAIGASIASAYAAVIPLMPSIKLMKLVAPTQKNNATTTITAVQSQLSAAVYNPILQNIRRMAIIWTAIRRLSGNDFTSSQKLIPHISTRPTTNGK